MVFIRIRDKKKILYQVYTSVLGLGMSKKSTKHAHNEKWFTSNATTPLFTFKSLVISAHSADSLLAVRTKIVV